MEHNYPSFIDDILILIATIDSAIWLLLRASGKAWNLISAEIRDSI